MQDKLDAVSQVGLGSSASTSQSIPLSVNTSSDSTVAVSSTPKVGATASWMPNFPSFPMRPGLFVAPGTPGPPGLMMSATKDSSSTIVDSNSSVLLRPSVPTASAPPNSGSALQPQIYPPYTSLPAMGGSSQGPWLPPPQMGVMTRPPFLPYPAVYPAPFSLPAHGVPHPSVSSADSQPPGVSSVGIVAATPTSAVLGHQLVATSGLQTESSPSVIGMLGVYARLLIN